MKKECHQSYWVFVHIFQIKFASVKMVDMLFSKEAMGRTSIKDFNIEITRFNAVCLLFLRNSIRHFWSSADKSHKTTTCNYKSRREKYVRSNGRRRRRRCFISIKWAHKEHDIISLQYYYFTNIINNTVYIVTNTNKRQQSSCIMYRSIHKTFVSGTPLESNKKEHCE